MQSHPILDRTDEIEVLSLGVDGTPFALIEQVDGQQRCVADHVSEAAEARVVYAAQGEEIEHERGYDSASGRSMVHSDYGS